MSTWQASLGLAAVLAPHAVAADGDFQIELRSQWMNPNDILSVLLIIGGDIVQKALAQLAGHRIVPVAFSFGWVAYAFASLMSILGDGKLMPPTTDCPSLIVNGKNGYIRTNNSWVLGRVLRDYEATVGDVGKAFTIAVFRSKPVYTGPANDWLWYSGIVTMVVQCGVATIPWGLYGDWTVFMVTAAGSLLAMGQGALPQWREEKWACRRKTHKVMSLTRGNGSPLVMVILGGGVGMDLEDLAAVRAKVLRNTKPLIGVFAMLWIVFLVTVAGLKNHSWFLLGIGCLGMFQNVVAAGAARVPAALNIHIEQVDTIEGSKAMGALKDLELAYHGVGATLVPVYFPGKLRPDEETWWEDARLRKPKEPIHTVSGSAV